MSKMTHSTNDLERPRRDECSYRVVVLKNELEALLVHDPNTDMARVSMSVGVGFFSDDHDTPGVAHLVKHILWMGTEKYPEENDFRRFIQKHAGSIKSSTESVETRYSFEMAINAEDSGEASPLKGALERFSQFFIAPLFNEESLPRAVEALQSEYEKGLQDDATRLRQLFKSFSNPDHPYHRFANGNRETLRDDSQRRVVDVLKKFHRTNYVASRMKLVVASKESLDLLQNWIEQICLGIPNDNVATSRWDDVKLYTEDQLCTQVFSKPCHDIKLLQLTFPFLDEGSFHGAQPSTYICYLLRKCRHGIQSYIRDRGWATVITAFTEAVCPGSAIFKISAMLTKDGLLHYQDLLRAIFRYIAMLKEEPPQQTIFDEIRKCAERTFDATLPNSSLNSIERLGSNMQTSLPREWLLSGSQMPRKFDPNSIIKALSYLRMDNCIVVIESQDVTGNWDAQERWYRMEFKKEKVLSEDLRDLEESSLSPGRFQDLRFPLPNKYISEKSSVGRKSRHPAKLPKLIRFGEGIHFWYKNDDRFGDSRTIMKILLKTPLVWDTPANWVKTEVFCGLVLYALVEESHDAHAAGLHYALFPSRQGITIQVMGYEISIFAELMIKTMRELVDLPERFQTIKSRVLTLYTGYISSHTQAEHDMEYLIAEKAWNNEECAAALEQVTAEDIMKFIPQLFERNHIETLVHGSMDVESASIMIKMVEKSLQDHSLPQLLWPVHRGLILPPGSNCTYQRQLRFRENAKNSMDYYLHIGATTDNLLCAKLSLTAQIIGEFLFQQLRTEEQLEDTVDCGTRFYGTTFGYYINLQSKYRVKDLESCIEKSLVRVARELAEMKKEDFELHKRSIIRKKLKKPESLESENEFFWSIITDGTSKFSLHKFDADNIESLKQSDVITFYGQNFDPASKTRAKLVVRRFAADEDEVPEGTSIITDVLQFKNGLSASRGRRVIDWGSTMIE